jgi:hypothetical protein
MNIRHIKSIDELRILAGSGIAFVNCSFGKEAEDFLQRQSMNFYNHGIFSNRPSIAIQFSSFSIIKIPTLKIEILNMIEML